MKELYISAPEEERFAHRIEELTDRIGQRLESALPPETVVPARLHAAMRYAVLTGGKRIRPLLVYATGECLDVDIRKLDVPAAAIELLHAFSLVHDDLPAMDDDDLRRGQPTVHRKFDEATAILAADALQPLAFRVIAASQALNAGEVRQLITLIADACGSIGMTGGQAIDLASEGMELSVAELTEMHGRKTGALIRASIMAPCYLASDIDTAQLSALDAFSADIGLAFQIRDDILDVTGQTDVIGKPAGSDVSMNKATWPSVFGMDESIRRCESLLESAMQHLSIFDQQATMLRQLASFIVERIR